MTSVTQTWTNPPVTAMEVMLLSMFEKGPGLLYGQITGPRRLQPTRQSVGRLPKSEGSYILFDTRANKGRVED